MGNNKLKLFFCWNASVDTWVALATVFLMWPIYFIGFHGLSWIDFFIFSIIGNLLLNVLFPIYYLCKIKKRPITDLGITTKFWKTSVLISILFFSTAIPGLMKNYHLVSQHQFIKQIIFNTISLWEVFFVFSWLMLVFNRSFGAVFALILTGLCMCLYHIGSYPNHLLPMLFFVVIFYGVIFLIVKNILMIWPLGWGAGATIGTLQGGVIFHGSSIIIYAIILIVQLLVIGMFCKYHQKN